MTEQFIEHAPSTDKKKKQAVRGLEGVVVCDTTISYVDGQGGNLYYRGFSLDEIAGKMPYEELVYLLWAGEPPDRGQYERFQRRLVTEMRLPSQIIDLLREAPPSANPMVLLRTAISALGMFDPDGGKNTQQGNDRKAIRILAQTATVVAAIYRIREGLPLVSADVKMGFAANFLYMLFGRKPTKLEESVVNTLLVLHADHGLAASSFAARVTVSTLAGMHSAISAALAALKGPLHGGANTRVMQMLEDIGAVSAVNQYINSMLKEGRKIMGFGHRVYKVEDPRSRHLRKVSEKLCKKAGCGQMFEISHHIEQQVMEKKGIHPNVDFYSATVQHALGIPKEYFTCVFAVSRTAGWIAHILEQFRDNRLIRPTSTYQGGFDRKYVPIEKR